MTIREGLQIEISGIPAENGKCRVETQLKIAFHLKDAQGASVKDWKQIRLPHSLIAKEKHRMEKFNGRNKSLQESDILTLDARLVCDHDMTKILETCDNCIGRERKRAHRRKEAQKLPGPLASISIFGSISAKNGHNPAALASEPIPPTPTDPEEYQAWEKSRIMVFSSTEYVDFADGQCLLPTRITCYCRHHNEKVGFRIQFTARDSAGAVVARVLTNAVMMMDDHKSGKKATPSGAKATSSATRAGSVDTRSSSIPPTLPSTPKDASTSNATETDVEEENQDEKDMELDLEAGNMGQNSYQDIFETSVKAEEEDSLELLSGDILSPLSGRGKRRVGDDSSMEDVQMQSTDPSRGPFRRKTSHDVSSVPMSPSPFSSTLPFGTDTLSAPSPFMPGSPFAKDDERNAFSPSFSKAMGTGSMLDQSTMDMYLSHANPSLHARSGSIHQDTKDVEQERLRAESASMMESFTTLDESMNSPPDAFQASVLASDISTENSILSESSSSSALASRSSFSISTPAFSSSSPIPSLSGSSTSQYFSPTIHPSPFTATFSSPMNGASTTMAGAPGMSSSFLDASQMQEFQNFKRQSMVQQQQQHLLMQLQKGVQNQKSIGVTPVPWTIPTVNKDPLQIMKAAMGQTTSPASSAFIPAAQTDPSPTTGNDSTNSSGAVNSPISNTDTTLGPKKRGRPRKNAAPTASEASSPVMSSTASLPSLSPSPHLGHIDAPTAPSASATAAQFLMYRQQQQLQQHHQQQLQQQQKQAILARQKPRVQKIIPSRGSVEGGTEITLLGSGFFPGMVPTFDGVPALSVQYYGAETVICKLPPRGYPGTVVVKAHNSGDSLGGAKANGMADGSSSNNELVRTMAQLFGGPGTSLGGLGLGDDDVGVLFEYEENKGDRDLMALALQVLGMKMNGRVEPPHQVAMRIMGTAAASNAVLGTNCSPAQIQANPLTSASSLIPTSQSLQLYQQQHSSGLPTQPEHNSFQQANLQLQQQPTSSFSLLNNQQTNANSSGTNGNTLFDVFAGSMNGGVNPG
ncbi:hypothetical protein BGZ82_008396 [Podila clonocystis]|nr:hypothetical protein BGZ82_008396 [Podila clonocystis]